MEKADELEVVRLYSEEMWTLRQIADRYATDHHRVKRILLRHGVEITRDGRRRLAFTDEHRAKIGAKSTGRIAWNRGRAASEQDIRRMITARMRSEIDLSVYPDLERLRLLIRLTSKHFKHFGRTDELRKAFLDRFYFDRAFNAIYDAWLAHDKSKWWFPSIDHINPKSNGGTFDLGNLQFLTWFENRAKADMGGEQWAAFKRDTGTKSALFIEAILEDNS